MTTFTRTSILALLFSTLSFGGIYPPQEGDLTAEIPFQFVVNAKTLPAGNYIIRAGQNGQVEVCEDGVYCETVRTRVQSGTKEALRVEFRHDGAAYHLSLLQATGGAQHDIPSSQEAAHGSDNATTSIEARPLCVHDHTASAAPTWH